MAARIGVDIGGTFTDLCAWDGRTFHVYKVPSTAGDSVQAIVAGLDGLAANGLAAETETLIHGSTVATNALLTRHGGRVALITTQGFGDVLHIGRQNRPELYNLRVRRAEPIVRREDCHEVDERIAADGSVVKALCPDAARGVLEAIHRSGIREVAVCLLFSFRNPTHERIIGELAQQAGVQATLSCELHPEFREYERASTTAVNAYVAPVARGHYAALEAECRNRGIRFARIMQSNGGQISVEVAAREPVRTILSGPAGGVIAGVREARMLGVDRLVTCDMGGTSTDVCLCAGAPATTTEAEIAGCPIRVPMLDIHTIGAGGGSIASLDAGGALQVGPQSAGASPGPACYGNDGPPTVTDANLILGRIVPERFLGGRFPLDARAAQNGVGKIAGAMSCTCIAAARGIIEVANAHMVRAVRRVTAERGADPTSLALCCFGGAGGLHACHLAASLHMPEVIIPANPGILSATGMLSADLVKDFSQSLPAGCDLGGAGAPGSPPSPDEDPPPVPPALRTLRETFSRLMDLAAEAVQREGYEQDDSELERMVDMRYRGQSHEITVPLASLSDVERLLRPFHQRHKHLFGHGAPDQPVQMVTARIRAIVPTWLNLPVHEAAQEDRKHPSPIGTQIITFDAPTQSTLYGREQLSPGQRVPGPALIVEPYATTLIPPEWHAEVAPTLALRLRPANP